jgi:hypothetical protein
MFIMKRLLISSFAVGLLLVGMAACSGKGTGDSTSATLTSEPATGSTAGPVGDKPVLTAGDSVASGSDDKNQILPLNIFLNGSLNAQMRDQTHQEGQLVLIPNNPGLTSRGDGVGSSINLSPTSPFVALRCEDTNACMVTLDPPPSNESGKLLVLFNAGDNPGFEGIVIKADDHTTLPTPPSAGYGPNFQMFDGDYLFLVNDMGKWVEFSRL